MNQEDARKFFLKSESYFNTNLPAYFNLSNGIDLAEKILSKKEFNNLYKKKDALSKAENVNHIILANKDGNYAWRPLQILHPIVYVDLVNEITKEKNWKELQICFNSFQLDKRIECISIPIESQSRKSDVAETILNWWENLEQAQIVFALDYEYCIHTDITDCYSSIYTHTIPWAVHTKDWAKANHSPDLGVGNLIDAKIRYLQNGQTNGIPQGSVLMDFVAEIVLGYADSLLSSKLDETLGCDIDFKILRYRDDYRIFSNSKDQVETIIKILADVLASLNLKLNSSKTFLAKDIIMDAIKPDKIYWESIHSSLISENQKGLLFKIGIQKHLLQIKILGEKYPNCGSLNKALSEIYKLRIEELKKRPNDIYQLISILVSIMVNNPRTIEHCIVILGRLFELIESNVVEILIDKILIKFANTPNTDFVELWLQRLSLIHTVNKNYKADICQKVADPISISIWNSDWLIDGFDESEIINVEYINKMSLTMPSSEIDLFTAVYE
ncbi:RNA-directed DNA polymerase [Carnobacterium inhibens]|nr:RNA-directed DNA polymerase [Carnobacterium inhibens]